MNVKTLNSIDLYIQENSTMNTDIKKKKKKIQIFKIKKKNCFPFSFISIIFTVRQFVETI